MMMMSVTEERWRRRRDGGMYVMNDGWINTGRFSGKEVFFLGESRKDDEGKGGGRGGGGGGSGW